MSSPPFPLFPVAVIGQGAVSPAGEGIQALLQNEPVSDSSLASLRASHTGHYPVKRVDPKLPGLIKWSQESRLRRASPVALFLVESAAQALAQWDSPAGARVGLVGTFFCGSPAYSRRFFEQTLRNGQAAASPALFPETVYNSPLSHAAAILGVDGAAYALVGDESAWVEAVRVAATWLARDEVDAVVVVAAEEIDIIAVEAYVAAGWLHPGKPFRPAEGSAAILLRRPQAGDNIQIDTIHLGCSYRNPAEARRAAHECFDQFFPTIPVFPSAGHSWLEPLARDVMASRLASLRTSYLGEAFVATAGWNTLRALNTPPPQRNEWVIPAWGQNHQISALKVTCS